MLRPVLIGVMTLLLIAPAYSQMTAGQASVIPFREGEALFKAGRYGEALAKFERSNSIAESSAALYMTGLTLIRLKRHADAILPLRKVTLLAPTNPEAYINLALAFHMEKRFSAAEIEARQAVKYKPDYQSAYFILGNALFAQKKFADAATAFESATRLGPTDIWSWFSLGQAYHHLGRRDDAMRAQRSLAALDAKQGQALLDLINKPATVAAPPAAPGSPAYYVGEANKLNNAGKYDDGLDMAKRALAMDPKLVGAHLAAGFAYHKLYRYDEATPHFKQAVELQPATQTNHFWLGANYRANEQYDLAEAVLKEAVRRDPKDPYSRYQLASAHLWGTLDYQQAVSLLTEAVRLKPDYASAHNDLGFAYQNLGQWDKALPEFQEAARLDPKSSLYTQNVGIAYVRLGRKPDAMRTYQALRQISAPDAAKLLDFINKTPPEPKQIPAQATADEYAKLGGDFFSAGELRRSYVAFAKAAAMNAEKGKEGASLFYTYSIISDNSKEVAKLLEYCTRLEPGFARYHIELADAYLRLKRYPEAMAEYQRGIQLRPDVQTPRLNLLAEAHRGLGLTFVAMGDKAQATRVLQRLQTLDKQLAQDLSDAINGKPGAMTENSSGNEKPAAAPKAGSAPRPKRP